MSNDKQGTQFKKSVEMDSDTNPNRSQPIKNNKPEQNSIRNKKILKQRQKAKEELILKYGMSDREAEETLRNIEKKAIKKHKQQSFGTNKKELIKKNNKKQIDNEEEYEVIIPQHVQNKEKKIKKSISEPKNNKIAYSDSKIKKNEKKIDLENRKKISKTSEKEINIKEPENKTKEKEFKQKTIDNDKKIIKQNTKENKEIDINSIYQKKTEKNNEKSHKINQKITTKEKTKEIERNENIQIKNIEKNKNNENKVTKDISEKISTKKPENNENKNDEKLNIDDIVSNLVTNYDNESSIEVNNISLSFDVENDKIDNLKEYFIRTIKRNKGNKTKFQALKNISFKIEKGEKVGIIGYNGAGKSTLLKVVTGIYYPDEGEVKVNGKISPLLSLGAGFNPNYSGKENIFLNGAVLGYEKSFIQAKYDEIVEFSELGDFINYPIKNYSSGMIGKLAFSIATIVEPDILIIDEVLGVGDVNFRKKSGDKMKSLMDGKTTVLLVSHSIGEIRRLCDKAIWIDKGELREMGEVNKVCDDYLKDSEKATKEQLMNIELR